MPLTCKIPSGKGHQPMREAFLSHIDALSKMQEFLGTLEGCFFPVAHKKQLFLHTGFGGYSRRCLWKLCCGSCACGSGGEGELWVQKKGKLDISHRYNHIPLLPSGPGGVLQELVVYDLPDCKGKQFSIKNKFVCVNFVNL